MAIREKELEIIKRDFPWIYDENFKCNMVLTDDIDSLLSCLLLKMYRPKWEIGCVFYDYRKGMYIKEGTDITLPLVGVDWSFPGEHMRCISNHMTVISKSDFETRNYNKNDLNMNIINELSSEENYHGKYNLSTFIMLAAILGHEFPDTLGAKIMALLPDSSYWARYQDRSYQDYDVQKKYLCEVFGFEDIWKAQDDFDRPRLDGVQDKLKIKSKLIVVDSVGVQFQYKVDIEMICRELGLNYNPEFLKGNYKLIQKHTSDSDEYRDRFGRIIRTFSKEEKADMFTFVATSKKWVKFSMPVVV